MCQPQKQCAGRGVWLKLCSHKYKLDRILKELQSKWVTRVWFKTEYSPGEREDLAAFALSPDSGLPQEQTFQTVTDLQHTRLRQFAIASHTDCSGRGEPPWLWELSHFPPLAEEGRELPALPLLEWFLQDPVSELSCKGGMTMLLQRYLASCKLSHKPNFILIISFLNSGNTEKSKFQVQTSVRTLPLPCTSVLLLDLLAFQSVRLKLFVMFWPDLAVLKFILIMLPLGLRSFIDLFLGGFFFSFFLFWDQGYNLKVLLLCSRYFRLLIHVIYRNRSMPMLHPGACAQS